MTTDRIKRPYHKKSDHWNKPENSPENPAQPTVVPIIEKHEVKMSKEYTYEDLPESIRKQIERSIEHRRQLNLPDDSEDRKSRALSYFKWQKERETK